MEDKRQTESVLAKLMGLERPLPSKQLRYGRKRVLSESYLQDIALIRQRQKWSFDGFSMDADTVMLERRDSSEDLQSSCSSEEFLEEDKMFQKLWLLSSIRKADKEYPSRGGSYLHKAKSPKKMESVLQNNNTGKTHYVQLLSCSNGSEPKSSYSVRKKGTYLGKRERDCLLGREALRNGSMATHGVAKQVANELQRSVWHDFLNAAGPVTTRDEAGHGQCLSNSTSFPSSGSPNCRKKNFNVHEDWCLNLVNRGNVYCYSLQEVNCKLEEDLTPRNSTSICSLHSENDFFCEETPCTLSDSSEYGTDVFCEETPTTPSGLSEIGPSDLFVESPALPLSPKEISPCSDVERLLNKNKECVNFGALSQQVVDDTFMPLHQADDGSPLNQMEGYKPHPDSASSMKDISSAAHFHGSEVKLQQSATEFFEQEAKRLKSMDVKDAEEGRQYNHTDEIIPGTCKTEESQVLSYLVDVLAESGLQRGNMEMCYKVGQPLENPINPFVFDSLEKKYSKQPSWLKSDRKLLFDRIKCALFDILHPYTGISTWRKHRKNKFVLLQGNQDIIKQELLAVLVKQEKEAKREPSDKVVGIDRDWLEVEEDIQIVVKEIEDILINELVEEIVITELMI